jgi:hypothetical protein
MYTAAAMTHTRKAFVLMNRAYPVCLINLLRKKNEVGAPSLRRRNPQLPSADTWVRLGLWLCDVGPSIACVRILAASGALLCHSD